MGLLRLLAALSVAIAHLQPFFYHLEGSYTMFWLLGPDTSVKAFFMLSGFYMALVLDFKYRGKDQIVKFYTNRFLRIYPLYFLALIIVFITQSNPKGLLTDTFLNKESVLFLILSNILIVGQDIAHFIGPDPHGGLKFIIEGNKVIGSYLLMTVAWTLSLEIIFYLLVPFLIKFKNRTLLYLILASFLIRFGIYQYELVYDLWGRHFFPAEFCFFLSGIVSFRLYKMLSSWFFSLKKEYDKQLVRMFLEWFCVLLIMVTIFYPYNGPWGFGLDQINIAAQQNSPVTHTSIRWGYLFFLFLGMPSLFLLTKDNKWDKFLGNLAFPIFIIHLTSITTPLMIFFKEVFKPENIYSERAFLFLSIILTSWLVHLVFLRPIDKYRNRRLK